MNPGVSCNDVHSRLNPVTVARVLYPVSSAEVVDIVKEAAANGRAVSICGSRHAMGGQQFGEGTTLLDLSGLKALGPLDRERGMVEAGAGLTWAELIDGLHELQADLTPCWTIRQKQTGADDLTLGGALSANIHGRGLRMAPVIGDVEAFTLVDATGRERRCSRSEDGELFRLVIGGYGCFGVITSVALRLAPRRKVMRHVLLALVDGLMDLFAGRIAEGFLYGDFQFNIDDSSPDFLHAGILSCYQPVDDSVRAGEAVELEEDDWTELLHLAHTEPGVAFAKYVAHYLKTQGSVYDSDTHQLTIYVDDYHRHLDVCMGGGPASEMITELYVPRDRLADFMRQAAGDLRSRGMPVIYGTVRLIERDTESALAWAREDFACVIFNLHIEHTEEGIERSAEAFRALIDIALDLGGSFYLTYHRWARLDQVERAYPMFRDFLTAKERHDPDGRFQSEWWRHWRDAFFEGSR